MSTHWAQVITGICGESLSGLARAFFLAGAHGLLVSHWDVVTGASVPLMIGTFVAGGDSAQALRAAQLRMIDSAGSSAKAPIEISHPNYWAAFVLIGDGVRAGPQQPQQSMAGTTPAMR